MQDVKHIHGFKGLVASLEYMSGRYPCSFGGNHFG